MKKHVKLELLQDSIKDYLSEDAVWAGVFEHYAVLAIADGAPQRLRPITSMQPMLDKYSESFGQTVTASGIASRLFCQTASTLAAKPLPLADMVIHANQHLAKELISIYGSLSAQAILQKEPKLEILAEDERYIRMVLPASTYTLARINWQQQTLEIAHGADSALIAIYKDGTAKQLTPDQMAQHDNKVKRSRLKNPEGLAKHPFFKTLHNCRATEINQLNGLYHNYQDAKGNSNERVGVSVLNGLPQVTHYMYQAVEDTKNIKAALLLTDGVFLPAEKLERNPSFEQERVQQMCDHIMQFGLESYFAFLRNEEKRIRNSGINPHQGHDDATAVLLSLS